MSTPVLEPAAARIDAAAVLPALSPAVSPALSPDLSPDLSPEVTAALLAALSATACGGGGDAASVALAPPSVPLGITDNEASRFLGQAAFGGTAAEIDRVKALGYSGWLDDQFNQPLTQGHYDWMVERGYAVDTHINHFGGADNTLWRKLMSSPDVLRQRVTLALSEIFVISMSGLPVSWRGFVVAAYADLLERQAFGSYRALLDAVTLSVGMGSYLNMRGNLKEDPALGRVPDENFAREVLQLFSLGLVDLAADGSPRGGVATDTYSQESVSGLARVFTGWDNDAPNRTEPGHARRPMILNATRHSTAEKRFLGRVIAAGTEGRAALTTALDTIANHVNVGPFIGRQLIQRLISSNPGAAYVGRVAAAFNDNGAGVRGDLKAVIKAVLLDAEARRAPADGDTARGKLREPVVRLIQWGRTFGLASPTGLWNIGNTSDPATRLSQSPLRSPSVFNFFRPGYVPPNSALGNQGITAPEFQITNESSVVGWANFAQTFVAGGIGETRPDYAAELALADNPAALVRRVAMLLAAGALSVPTLETITNAVTTIGATTDAGRANRVHAAVHLVLCAPEYLVQV